MGGRARESSGPEGGWVGSKGTEGEQVRQRIKMENKKVYTEEFSACHCGGGSYLAWRIWRLN